MDKNDYIEALIAKVLSGEASVSEVKELDVWKQASPENLEYFRILEKIYLKAPEVKSEHSFDADVAWNKLKFTIEKNKQEASVKTITGNNSNFSFLRIAASLILVAGISFALYKVFFNEKIRPVTLASAQTIEEFKLPDSTGVVLNRNSQLVYSFSGNHRKVELKGEAFFDLATDPKRPFEIKAGNLIIQDIGTSFNVKAVDGSDSVIVFVESGEVILTSSTNNYINLVKGEKAVYLKKRDQFIREILTDTNALAYKTKIFVFENASLVSAIQKINEVYGVNIILSENIKACHITATFKNETANAVIDVIAETLRLKVTSEKGKILMEGESCEE
ncbi:MAG TPA: FecR family protein [Bacteroidia bacterium]|nr:FecR family protein [Bacteroidia bacterium]